MSTHRQLVLTQGSHPTEMPPSKELSEIWKSFTHLGTKVVLKSKKTLFHEGDQNKYSYIIMSGYLLLTKHNTLLDIVEPGQSLGAALLSSRDSKQSYPVTASSIDQSEVLQICSEAVLDLMNSDSRVNQYFINQFKARMHYMQQWRVIATLPVVNRIAFFLVQKKSVLQSATITRKMIALAVNSTPETVIRTLASFEKKNIIAYYGRKIILIDLKYLEELCL